MFQKKCKNPPPRPPPPNFLKLKSKSLLNINDNDNHPNNIAVENLIDWNPKLPTFTTFEKPRKFCGSACSSNSNSSSTSTSASSLTSSKKSLNESYFSNVQFLMNGEAAKKNHDNSNKNREDKSPIRPRIIRPLHFNADIIDANCALPMPKRPPPSPPKGDTNIITPYAIALYDYQCSEKGDLQFQVNDVIILLRRINNEWLFGKNCHKASEGIFPANFVKIEVPLPLEEKLMTDMYEFKPHNACDLELKSGQN